MREDGKGTSRTRRKSLNAIEWRTWVTSLYFVLASIFDCVVVSRVLRKNGFHFGQVFFQLAGIFIQTYFLSDANFFCTLTSYMYVYVCTLSYLSFLFLCLHDMEYFIPRGFT